MADETPLEDAADQAREPMHEPETLHGAPVTNLRGERVAHVGRDDLVAFTTAIFDDGYRQCLDVCGVDYLTHPGRTLPDGVERGRFEVVYTFISHADRTRLRARVQVPGDDPSVPTISHIHAGADAPEREVYDMFGITVVDHPDLTRILMPETWQGHPLRKDYDVGRVPVQFKGPAASR